MRKAFVAALGELMDQHPSIVLLTADLGYGVLEPLFEAHPDRVINVGVAEQSMAGMAAGLAQAGCIPFVYSIATFATLRGYEFIRDGAVVHGLPVRIIGIGGGFEYGAAGISHYALEDLAVMRAQPGMSVIAPADSAQAVAALRATWDLPGPVYYRIGKSDAEPLAEVGSAFRLGHVHVVARGRDVALLSTGAITREMLQARRELEEAGVSCVAAVVGCLAPSPTDGIADVLRGVALAVTVESHYVTGGLGSLVAETIADRGLGCRLLRIAVPSTPHTFSGGQAYMERRFGLDAHSIVARVSRCRSQMAPPQVAAAAG